MAKLLKVLVIILLILSIVALSLGSMLFMKREILKGRTRKLENAVMALATTIEAGPPTLDAKPEYPAKDISPVTSELLDNPELSPFWDDYSHELELQDQVMLDLRQREAELMAYYKIDMATGRPERDIRGNRETDGPGTTQGVLSDLLAKAEEQLNTLSATRQQLTDLRVEFVSVIGEFNDLKHKQRRSLKKIGDQDARIARLNNDIASLKQNAAELEDQNRALEDERDEQQRQIALLEEEKAELDTVIDQLREELKKYENANKEPDHRRGTDPPVGPTASFSGQIDPGVKGKVVAVNPEWNFVIVNLSDQFMRELLSDKEAGIPQVELLIKRPGPPEKFITKVRLIEVQKSEKLGICDILPDWQQAPVQKDDVVFY